MVAIYHPGGFYCRPDDKMAFLATCDDEVISHLSIPLIYEFDCDTVSAVFSIMSQERVSKGK